MYYYTNLLQNTPIQNLKQSIIAIMNSHDKTTNLDYLIGLSKGNSKFVEEMIEIFLTENPKEIRSLEESIRNEDFVLIKTSAHKMKSTIPFVGLDIIIGEDLSEIEKLSLEKRDINRIITLLKKIKEVCIKATQELQSF